MFRMEKFTEGFCVLKNYTSTSKKLSATFSSEVKKFVQFVKENRNKRKLTGLSFEVGLFFMII